MLASFGDANHGAVVMSETSLVHDTYVTWDAGRTWHPRHVGISATTFFDQHRAIAVEAEPRARLESTADAGRTWVQLATPVRSLGLAPGLNRVTGGPTFLAVVSARTGALFVAAQRARPDAVPDLALLRSLDGGERWTEVHLPHKATVR